MTSLFSTLAQHPNLAKAPLSYQTRGMIRDDGKNFIGFWSALHREANSMIAPCLQVGDFTISFSRSGRSKWFTCASNAVTPLSSVEREFDSEDLLVLYLYAAVTLHDDFVGACQYTILDLFSSDIGN